MFSRNMEKREKNALIVTAVLVLSLVVGFFIWYNLRYTYRPDQTEFRLRLCDYYSDRQEVIVIDDGVLTVTTKYLTSNPVVKSYELAEADIKTFSDYLVRKKRFFFSLDDKMTADPPDNTVYTTGKYTDRPYQYDIWIRFTDLEKKFTDYDYSKTLRLMDMRNFIRSMTDTIAH